MAVPLALIIASASELGKLALQSYFQYARMSGMTPEQIESTYQAEKIRFASNAPETFPDVPPDDLATDPETS